MLERGSKYLHWIWDERIASRSNYLFPLNSSFDIHRVGDCWVPDALLTTSVISRCNCRDSNPAVVSIFLVWLKVVDQASVLFLKIRFCLPIDRVIRLVSDLFNFSYTAEIKRVSVEENTRVWISNFIWRSVIKAILGRNPCSLLHSAGFFLHEFVFNEFSMITFPYLSSFRSQNPVAFSFWSVFTSFSIANGTANSPNRSQSQTKDI